MMTASCIGIAHEILRTEGLSQGLTGNKGWTSAWREPEPKPAYDVIIIGAGPAGLAAALAAGRAGAKVILADEDFRMGGRLKAETYEVDGKPGSDWAASACAELASLPNVRCMTRTVVYGAYDHGIYGALERKTDHLISSDGKPRQVLWRIYSKHAILAADLPD